MFTPEQYRAKATEYKKLLETTRAPNEKQEFQQLERTFTTLADNAQWLTDNCPNIVHAPGHCKITDTPLTAEEEHMLRRLAAALIMHWDTISTKLQQELLDSAETMGDPIDTAVLRVQMGRFLHKAKAIRL